MRKRIALLLAVVLVVSLTSCGRKEQAETGSKRVTEGAVTASITPTMTPTNTPTPTPTEVPKKPEPVEIPELYPEASYENMYEIDIPGSEEYIFTTCMMRDNYLLAYGYNYSIKSDTEDHRALFLVDLANPGNVIIRECGAYYADYYLINNGNVMEIAELDAVHVYDKKFSQIYSNPNEWGTYIGCSDNGTIWFFGQGRLSGYCGGEEVYHFQLPEVVYGMELLGEKDGETYFSLRGEQTDIQYYHFREGEKELKQIDNLQRAASASGLLLVYESPFDWYLASVDEPNTIVSFPKDFTNESVFAANENLMITSRYEYDESYATIQTMTKVFDMRNGGLCSCILPGDLGEGVSPCAYAYDSGYVVILGDSENIMTEMHQKVYLYDIRNLSADERVEGYCLFHADLVEDADPIIAEIEAKYPIQIYTTPFALGGFNAGYNLIATEDQEMLHSFLVELQYCLEQYPEGFYEDVLGESKKGIRLYICDAFVSKDDFSLENPVACVNRGDDYILAAFDVIYAWCLAENLLHETMHMMEVRLMEYEANNDFPYEKYWNEVLNSPKYPYFFSYVDLPNGEAYFAGTEDGGSKDVWFIDAYAKTDALEDRARTLENMMLDGSVFYFDYPHIVDKAKFLSGIIREVFPSVKKLEEQTIWERRTGIIDIYEEFPDFATYQ